MRVRVRGRGQGESEGHGSSQVGGGRWVLGGEGWGSDQLGVGVRGRAMVLTRWAVAHLDDVVVVGWREDGVGSGRVLQVLVVQQDLVPAAAVAAGVTIRTRAPRHFGRRGCCMSSWLHGSTPQACTSSSGSRRVGQQSSPQASYA